MSYSNPPQIHTTDEATSSIPAPKEPPVSALIRNVRGIPEWELFVQEPENGTACRSRR